MESLPQTLAVAFRQDPLAVSWHRSPLPCPEDLVSPQMTCFLLPTLARAGSPDGGVDGLGRQYKEYFLALGTHQKSYNGRRSDPQVTARRTSLHMQSLAQGYL